jgi:hypothetical protein
MGFLDRLDEIAPGLGRLATALRGGFTEQDYARVRPDAQIYQLPEGSISAVRAVQARGRAARFGVPVGWAEQSSSELAVVQAHEPSGAQVHVAMYRPDAPADVVFSMRAGSVSGMGNPSPATAPEQWPLGVERQTGLRTVSNMRRVEFAGDVGYYWSLQGSMAGFRLGRPNQPTIEVHSIEMWAPLGDDAMLKFICIAPPPRAQEAAEGINTVISSWQW